MPLDAYLLAHLNILSVAFKALNNPPNDSSQNQFIINTVLGVFNILAAALIPIWIFVIQNRRGMAFEAYERIVYLPNPTTNPSNPLGSTPPSSNPTLIQG